MDVFSAFENLGPGFYIAFVAGVAVWWYMRAREDEEEGERQGPAP